jgi:hypothetical protein
MANQDANAEPGNALTSAKDRATSPVLEQTHRSSEWGKDTDTFLSAAPPGPTGRCPRSSRDRARGAEFAPSRCVAFSDLRGGNPELCAEKRWLSLASVLETSLSLKRSGATCLSESHR